VSERERERERERDRQTDRHRQKEIVTEKLIDLLRRHEINKREDPRRSKQRKREGERPSCGKINET